MNTKQIQIRLGVLSVLCLFLCILLSFTTIASAADQVTVTLNPNGGTVSQATLTVTPGSAYGTLPNPIRSGYVFTGWWTSESGGTQTTSDTTVSQSANHTLYAHWTQLVSVVFNPNGGSIAGQGEHNSTLDDSNIVTDTKAGSGGADISVIEGGYSISGLSAKINEDPNHEYNLLADDFILPVKASVSEMEFYAYQTGSTTTSTITGIYLMIYDGDPSLTTSKIIWGDNVTNRLKSTSWTGVYRVLNTSDAQSTTRPVMNVVADTSGLSLNAGTYWFAFGLTGTLQSGPLVPPVCIPGDKIAVGNSRKKTVDGWQVSTDNAGQGSQTLAVPYKVRYQGDGFSVPVGSTYGTLPTPLRVGYTFNGWWTAESDGNQVTENTEVTDAASRTLYAHWLKQVVVTFDPGAGSVSTRTVTVTHNTNYGDLPEPTFTGHVFNGWWTQQAGGVRISNTSLVTETNDHTLYAHWIALIDVSLDPNGGSLSTTSISVQEGATYGTLPEPMRSNYVFNGWWTDKNAGTNVTSGTVAVENQTLYAHWTKVANTVTFNPTGGKVITTLLNVPIGAACGSLPVAVRPGYVFNGWWTESEEGTQVTSETVVADDLTLYAHWTQLVSVVFNPNGGSIAGQGKLDSTLDDSNIVTDTKAGSGGADISVVEGGYNIYGQSANINQDPNHGYYLLADDFTLPVKASVSEMEFYAYQTGSTTTSTITGIYLMIYDGDPSLAASKIIWGDNVTNRLKSTSWTGVYRVSPDFQGDTIRPVMNVVADTSGLSLDAGTYWFAFGLTGTLGSGPYVPPVCIPGDEISVGNSKQKLESGWQDSTDTLLQNTSQLRVIAVPYKVRYQVDGFTVLYGHPYGSLPVPTRSGYVFDGWWTSSTGGERVTSSTIASNSASHTLYAHWSSYAPAYEHRLIFYTNSGNDFAPALFTAGTKVDLSAYIPTREGFDFIGWYSDKELTVPVASVTLSNSVAVYAKWAEKAAAAFEDVPADAYYCDAVKWAVGKNVAEGTSSFAFDPDTVCTRAQMVTFLWRAMGCPEPTLTACPFTDVGSDAYYYKAVLWAAEKGIAKGTTAVTFSPNDAVTRGQAVSFLYRAAGMPKSGTSNPFSDVGPNDYWYDAVLWAAEKTITGGTSAATYSPADGCTRSQIITFLYRFLGR